MDGVLTEIGEMHTMALTDTSVFFGGNDLETIVGASLIDHDFNQLPSRQLNIYKLARANKSVLTSAEYSSKDATVNFILKGCDRGEAEAVLQTLKSYLRPVNAPLIVSQGGIDITYNGATLNELNMRWVSNKIIITIVFTIADPIGFEDSDSTFLATTNVTTSSASYAVDNDGSFDAEPVINIIINTVTGATDQSLSVKNEETGQGITLTRTWANGDTVEIDSDNKTVIINGTNSDFSGQFPVFPPGLGSLGYSDTFSTRSVDISSTYQKHVL